MPPGCDGNIFPFPFGGGKKIVGFGWMNFGVILILKRWGGGYFAVL